LPRVSTVRFVATFQRYGETVAVGFGH
jgi:hypothetical protein